MAAMESETPSKYRRSRLRYFEGVYRAKFRVVLLARSSVSSDKFHCMKLPKRFTCILVLLAMPSLKGCVYTSHYTRSKPQMSDMIGTWVVTSDSLRDMKMSGSHKISTHQIVLRSNGTFSMQNMPSWIFDSFGSKFKSDNGTWDLNKDMCDDSDCWWGVAFWSSKTNIQANIVGDEPPYSIEFVLGDWDEGNFFVLEKKQTQTQSTPAK